MPKLNECNHLKMPLLSADEAMEVSDAFLHTLYGTELFSRWRDMKLEMNFISEREFVSWVIDVIEEYKQFGVGGYVGAGAEGLEEYVGGEEDSETGHSTQQHQQQQQQQTYQQQSYQHQHEPQREERRQQRGGGVRVPVKRRKMSSSTFQQDEWHEDDVKSEMMGGGGGGGVDITVPRGVMTQLVASSSSAASHCTDMVPAPSISEGGGDATSLPYTKQLDIDSAITVSEDKVGDGGGDGKRFSCNICGYSSKRRNKLTIHVNVHTGQKPYSCEYCGRAFADPSSRLRHIKRVHTKPALLAHRLSPVPATQQPPTSHTISSESH